MDDENKKVMEDKIIKISEEAIPHEILSILAKEYGLDKSISQVVIIMLQVIQNFFKI